MKLETYELKIPGEIEVTFLNYGGIIQSLRVPDKLGALGDVVLGFDTPEEYLKDHPYFGALIGRYANRISGGAFTLLGKEYELPRNEGKNSLHGGLIGFDKILWKVSQNSDGTSFTLLHKSPHLHQGYPGNLSVEVTYTVSSGGEFIIDYKATTDKETYLNLTNHSYFNLSAGESPTILNHQLWINSDFMTAIDEERIPTGMLIPVNKDFDFRIHKIIGKEISRVHGGYDHNYVLPHGPLHDPRARLIDASSGRMLEIFTTEPGLQFYSGNFLDGSLQGKKGLRYFKHAGLCLEPQHFPDSPHHRNFPSTLLKPGDEFRSKTLYKFTTSSISRPSNGVW